MKYAKSIRMNFEERLTDATQNFERICTADYSKELCKKLLFFYDNYELAFLSFFQRIMCWKKLDSLEGLELFNLFVGNFVDDGSFNITYNEDYIHILNSCNAINETNEDIYIVSKSKKGVVKFLNVIYFIYNSLPLFLKRPKEYKPEDPKTNAGTWIIQECSCLDTEILNQEKLFEIIDEIITHEKYYMDLIEENNFWEKEDSIHID